MEQVIFLNINEDAANLGVGQTGFELTTDADLGYKMFAGKHHDGHLLKFLCKDRPAKVSSLKITDLVGGGNRVIKVSPSGEIIVSSLVGSDIPNHNDLNGLTVGNPHTQYEMHKSYQVVNNADLTINASTRLAIITGTGERVAFLPAANALGDGIPIMVRYLNLTDSVGYLVPTTDPYNQIFDVHGTSPLSIIAVESKCYVDAISDGSQTWIAGGLTGGNIKVSSFPSLQSHAINKGKAEEWFRDYVKAQKGQTYPITSSGATEALFDTGISRNSENGFGLGAVYELQVTGNSNLGGNGDYINVVIGEIIITTGFNGSVKSKIFYLERGNFSTNGYPFSVDVRFSENSSTAEEILVGDTISTIVVRVDGYINNVGYNTRVRLIFKGQ